MGALEFLLSAVGFIAVIIGIAMIVGSYLSSDRDMDKDGKSTARRLGTIVVIIGILMAFASSCFVIVPAGNVGVADTFGVVGQTPLQPGLHVKLPWTDVYMFTTQVQKYYDTTTGGDKDVAQIDALSNEGLKVTMDIAVNYHIDGNMAPELYRTVGLDYQNVIMKPPVHSVPRDLISKYDAKTLYSASSGNGTENRAKIEQDLFTGISHQVLDESGQSRGIVIEQVYLRNIVLPTTLTTAIESKLSMEQQIQQKQFEVQKQNMESDRMRAEAQGIADANKIIANSLTQSYLEWYAIEMMKSHTGATYFIPINSDGRYSPNPVIPIAGSNAGSNNLNAPSDLVTGLRNTSQMVYA
jgi:regulator of protease activity HflC (stomatin/prohibitin superfamily)